MKLPVSFYTAVCFAPLSYASALLNDGVNEGNWTPMFTYHTIPNNVGTDMEIRGDNLRLSISRHSPMPYRTRGATELAKFKVEDDILRIPYNENIWTFLSLDRNDAELLESLNNLMGQYFEKSLTYLAGLTFDESRNT